MTSDIQASVSSWVTLATTIKQIDIQKWKHNFPLTKNVRVREQVRQFFISHCPLVNFGTHQYKPRQKYTSNVWDGSCKKSRQKVKIVSQLVDIGVVNPVAHRTH